MCIYGYVRVSTGKQSIERQIRKIKTAYPAAVMIQDEYTGTKLDRPGWTKTVKAGDTIVFDSVSRMSHNAEDGFITYQELYNKGVSLVFLKERYIDTEVYHKALEDNLAMTGTSVDLILEGLTLPTAKAGGESE